MFYKVFVLMIWSFILNPFLSAQSESNPILEKTKEMKKHEGFFNFYWDNKEGKIWLEIDKIDIEFLYVNSLPAGIGSNDIGLDRGQLGDDRVVKFYRSGNKVLLTQLNYDYRAVSDNPEEQKSVEQAFAQSVLWGFKIESESDGRMLVDATEFFLRDAHNVKGRLKRRKQGEYKLDETRSAIYLERTKNFKKNSEFEAVLTFKGDAKHEWIRSVTPSSSSVTVRQHHSFIELPDDNYEPREFDPRCGFFQMKYQDYATPISQPLIKRFITRHRLEKKNPGAARSEPVEPIIYYIDRGAPEPIKSALIEGAMWWNQAFEAAGYINAFQVKELPAEADPMDVQYNLIQWVHRSTRGWSYGSSVSDPRTGEIIKGHVSLGSLRVRQDFLIAQGLIPAYEKDGITPDPRLLEMALARLRQLSAHEVGHTIGLAHNFSASVNDRASVMDYPHPYIELDENGAIDFSKAYDNKIGAWDKRTVLYGYQDFPEGTDEKAALTKILKDNIEQGFLYISDQDARPHGGAHPSGHLWDNGKTPIEELSRLFELRAKALNDFGEKNIPKGTPMADLERVLVPLYLMHRYQVEAVSKLIGGVNYTYAANGDGQATNRPVDLKIQQEAVELMLKTLEPKFLALPEHIVELIPPQPIGYDRDRELFKTNTGLTFDPLAAAESSINNTLKMLLNTQRLSRYVAQGQDLKSLFSTLWDRGAKIEVNDLLEEEIKKKNQEMVLNAFFGLANHKKGSPEIGAAAFAQIKRIQNRLGENYFDKYLERQIQLYLNDPDEYSIPKAPEMPDGSPIGCGHH